MSHWLYKLRDLLLVALFGVLLLMGLWGAVLPSRSVFAQAGAYQLEAFESGLAFYHYGLNGQPSFYQISVLNDAITDSRGQRLNYASSSQMTIWQVTKPAAFLSIWQQFFQYITPWYERQTEDGVNVRYTTRRDGDDWLIDKTVTFTESTFVGTASMSLSYDRANVTMNESAMQVLITDEDRPGFLVVVADQQQRLSINQEYGFVEVTDVINSYVSSFTQTMRVRVQETP